MSWPHLFNRLPSRTVRRTGRARIPRPRWRFVRPCLEVLEDRTLLSVMLTNSFEGISSAQQFALTKKPIEPPDIQGAAGPSSVVSTVNLAIRIFTKDTGTPIDADSLADFFFKEGGLPPAAPPPFNTQTDPFTLFDPLVQRFIVGEIDYQVDSNGDAVQGGRNTLLLAVSKDATPDNLTNAEWFFDSIDTTDPAVALQDYPGVPGFNADALVVTLFGYPPDENKPQVETQVNAISMNALINGTPLTLGMNLFQTDAPSRLREPHWSCGRRA